jgi:tRNA(Leu) C34 or U34 (ribose-2'-O)-methylase TrmL
MIRLVCITICLLLGVHTVFAQNTFAFKAKVLHNKNGMMKQFSLLVNSNIAVTNDAGIFVIPLTNNTNHVKIQLQQNNYTVLYPTAGYVAVPRDLNDMPEIIIGSPADNTYLNQYLNLYKAIRNNKSATSAEVRALDVKLDSLQKILLQLNYSESELRTAKDMQDGRDKYYPEISENLNEFVSRAFDLKAAFQHVAKFAFDNPAATQRLHDAATSYTNIYNVLNRQRMNYQKQINENWRDDSLTNEYIRVIGFALDTLHTAKLYPLQSDITLINEYFFGKKTKELKDKIQQHIKEQEISIQPTLEELRRRNLAFQKQLTL